MHERGDLGLHRDLSDRAYVFSRPVIGQMHRFDDDFEPIAKEWIRYYSLAIRIGIPCVFMDHLCRCRCDGLDDSRETATR